MDADTLADPIRSSRCTVTGSSRWSVVPTKPRRVGGWPNTTRTGAGSLGERAKRPGREGHCQHLAQAASESTLKLTRAPGPRWLALAGPLRPALRPRPGREPQAAAAPDTAGAGRPRPRFCNLRGQMLGPGWQCTQWQGHRRRAIRSRPQWPPAARLRVRVRLMLRVERSRVTSRSSGESGPCQCQACLSHP